MKTVHHSILVSIGFLLALGYSPIVQAAPGSSIKSSSELTPIAQLEPNATTTPASPLLSTPIVAPKNPMPSGLGNESVSKDTVIPGQNAVPNAVQQATPSPDTKLDIKEVTPVPTPIAPLSVPTSMPPATQFPVSAPDFLTTPANPLLFPTKPEEVKLQGVRSLTLEETIELAERNNRDLDVSRLQVQQQQAAVREAQASLYPTLDLQSNLNRSLSASGTIGIKAAQAGAISQFGSEASARSLSPQSFQRDIAAESTSWDTSLQLNYDLYTSGANAARRRIAAGNLRAAELAMERIREQLRLDVTGQYYDLQDSNEQVNINLQSVKNSEQNLKDASAQERAGLGTKFDVLRSQVQLANNQQQLTNSLANEEVNRRKIAQTLSLPEYVTVNAADPIRPVGNWKMSLEETIVTAYKERVELEEQLVQRDISEAGRKQALSALGPKVQLQGRYDLLKVFEQPVSEPSSGYSLAAVATWRLFDGGAARAQAKQQDISKQIAETRFTQSRNNIRFQVEQSYATLTSSGKNIETTTIALGQACEARRLAKLRFDAGVGTQTDVLNAETDLSQSAGSRVTAILNYNRSIAQLLRAVSNVNKSSLVSTNTYPPTNNQRPDFCSPAYTDIR